VHLYAKAAVAFCVQVPDSKRELLESGVLHDFNQANHADLGYFSFGQFGNDDLYLSAFYEEAEPQEPKEFNPLSIRREDTRVWRRELEKFLREQEIEPLSEIRFRILADLDN
jgi:hypothetical protein